MTHAIRQLLTACMLLTRLPVARLMRAPLPRGHAHGVSGQESLGVMSQIPSPLAETVWAWPVVGGAIGLFTALVTLGLVFMHLPPGLAVFWAIAVQLCLTGALHEDGLMDSADGLFGGRDIAQRLDIMRDSRVGSYGALAGGLALLGKWCAYNAICRTLSFDLNQTIFAFAAAAAFARLGMIWVVAGFRPARADGMASRLELGYGDTIKPFLAAVIFSLFVGVAASVAAALLTALTALCARRYASARVNGYTGDILGAVSVVTELVILTLYCTMGRGALGAL